MAFRFRVAGLGLGLFEFKAKAFEKSRCQSLGVRGSMPVFQGSFAAYMGFSLTFGQPGTPPSISGICLLVPPACV